MSEQTQVTVQPKADVAPIEATPPLVVERKPQAALSAEEARTVAVGELLANAYAGASNLKLTEAESKALRAPFDAGTVRGGAKGDSRLLYISHIYVSDRLNDVLGIGQWALVKRSQRAEQTKTSDGKQSLTRIYYEGALLIRGAFVTEAIGVGHYHPNNPKEDYGSALESAMSDCLTRCCKRLGIGSQVWDKRYCDRWLEDAQRKPVGMPSRVGAAGDDAPPDDPREEAPDPAPGDERKELVAAIRPLYERAKAAQVKRVMDACGIKQDEGEAWEAAPTDTLKELKRMLGAIVK